MMVATLQLKAPKLIVYFVSFTVVIFTILNVITHNLYYNSEVCVCVCVCVRVCILLKIAKYYTVVLTDKFDINI